ncbi:efflux RND transporter periplasmic adaptor subunit [Maribacter sp. 2-571]|uniref:efflux RND transporter periplasmic adaptor subunit n=1 Tax=Maribacter sp. 2-571 TaxID=3417569 RepID=UPI003D354210
MKLKTHRKVKVLSCFLVLCLVISCSKKQAPATSLLPVKVSPVLQKKIIQWDEYTGRFEATQRVEVRARVSGYVQKVHFKDGQMVKEGDILYTIDKRPFTIALKEAKAAYDQSLAEYKQAEENFKRVKSLRESGAVSIEEFDRRKQAMIGGQARSEVARAAIDRASLNLGFTTVKAPLSGRISRDMVNAGNLIDGGSSNGSLLTTIVSIDPIYFYFEGSEADFLKYAKLNREGKRGGSRQTPNPVEVRLLNEEDFVHKGNMNFVNNEISSNTGTIQARAVFDNPDHVLEPGMFGRARLLGSGEFNAILVPDKLIATNQTVKFLYTMGTDSVIRTTPVSLGTLYKKKYRVITEGLKGDEILVLDNLQKLQAEMKVSPVTEALHFTETEN